MECGYLSNLREARRIADPDYRERFAEALAQALAENPGSATVLAGQLPAAPPATNLPAAVTNKSTGQEPGDQSD